MSENEENELSSKSSHRLWILFVKTLSFIRSGKREAPLRRTKSETTTSKWTASHAHAQLHSCTVDDGSCSDAVPVAGEPESLGGRAVWGSVREEEGMMRLAIRNFYFVALIVLY